MPLSFFQTTVVRLRPDMVEERGTTVPDWTDPDRLEIGGCSLQPAATSTDMQGRLAVMDGVTLYAPAGADIAEGDRVECGGKTYAVDGVPRAWASPTGTVSNLQVHLRDWKG